MAFTLRLNDEEESFLAELKKHLGKTTDSGTIKAVIARYMQLNDQHEECKKQLRASREEHTELLDCLDDLQQAQKRLDEFTSTRR
jgi:predicted nuclease with TOPRIM domain